MRTLTIPTLTLAIVAMAMAGCGNSDSGSASSAPVVVTPPPSTIQYNLEADLSKIVGIYDGAGHLKFIRSADYDPTTYSASNLGFKLDFYDSYSNASVNPNDPNLSASGASKATVSVYVNGALRTTFTQNIFLLPSTVGKFYYEAAFTGTQIDFTDAELAANAQVTFALSSTNIANTNFFILNQATGNYSQAYPSDSVGNLATPAPSSQVAELTTTPVSAVDFTYLQLGGTYDSTAHKMTIGNQSLVGTTLFNQGFRSYLSAHGPTPTPNIPAKQLGVNAQISFYVSGVYRGTITGIFNPEAQNDNGYYINIAFPAASITYTSADATASAPITYSLTGIGVASTNVYTYQTDAVSPTYVGPVKSTANTPMPLGTVVINPATVAN